MDFISGEILLIDKPLGWTSFDAVKRVRGALTRRMKVKRLKVGHAGTLDPLATGVMVICTGRATKRIDQLQAGVKEYIATLSLGATTPSFDLETEVDATYPIDHITPPARRRNPTEVRSSHRADSACIFCCQNRRTESLQDGPQGPDPRA